MTTPETEFRSDQQIAIDFLSYLRSNLAEDAAYEVTPTRLTGGMDAQIYRYKLVGQDPRVLRILRPAREEEELLGQQFIHKVLNKHGVNTPVIHTVCSNRSILGGVFAIMDLLPGESLTAQTSEVQINILGESMAKLHELDVIPIIEELRRAGVGDELYLSPAVYQKYLDFANENLPWASELVDWLRDHLPLSEQDLSVIHGDYHAGNLIVDKGSLTGLLDWNFCIADPASDLANMMNNILIFVPQISVDIPLDQLEKGVTEVLKVYQAIRPINHERIKAFRVLHLLKILHFSTHYPTSSPEFMRSPESQLDYAVFIEQTTGLNVRSVALAPPAA